jgi:type IV secretion system protein VirB10
MSAAVAIGVLVFLSMGQTRDAHAAGLVATPTPAKMAQDEAGRPVSAPASAPQSLPGAAETTAAPVAPVSDAIPYDPRAPVLVLDLAPISSPPASAAQAPPAGTASNAQPGLLGEEMFAQRVGAEQPASATSVRMLQPSRTIPQGALIPAVLETAVNSDLPGFARAMVSKDVRGFDGAEVLIPRGARLIGQYKSGLAAGQTRAYVVWSRVLLPDGSSIQLGSPLVDNLGETGATGAVDKHFAERFGAASALSVLGGLIGALGNDSSVVITTSAQAQSVAAIALQNDGRIPPTIRIAPGEPIQVFVARDLVFAR